jgi:serine/threonine-protein kinase RsbW
MSDRSPVRTTSEEFAAADLGRIRAMVGSAGEAAGVGPHRVIELVAAVNELVVNVILYAGGRGRIAMISSPDGLSVEVSDQGSGLPPAVLGLDRPPADVPGGRGLWLTRQMFPDLLLDNSPQGLTVTLFATAAPPGG